MSCNSSLRSCTNSREWRCKWFPPLPRNLDSDPAVAQFITSGSFSQLCSSLIWSSIISFCSPYHYCCRHSYDLVACVILFYITNREMWSEFSESRDNLSKPSFLNSYLSHEGSFVASKSLSLPLRVQHSKHALIRFFKLSLKASGGC